MSIQDERELRSQLAGLLDGVDVRPAPVAAAIHSGRRIRMWRRIAAVAGAAAVVAAAIVLPTVLPARPHSAPPLTPLHYKVTTGWPGPTAHGGVIAEGVTDGKSWRIVASDSPAPVTIQAVGAIGSSELATGPVATPDLVDLERMGDPQTNYFFGTVSHDVTRVVVQLPDHEHPVLTPVSWGGHRWIGLVLPARVPIVRAVAYAGQRELAYSIPFRGTETVAWWQPGQHGPARMTTSIGSGVISGRAWHATAWVGPWGWCFSLVAGNTSCYGSPLYARVGQALVQTLSCSGPYGKSPTSGVMAVAPDVRRVALRLSDGTSQSYRTVAIPGGRVFGYEIPARVRISAARAYGARGQLVGSMTGAQTKAC